MNILSYLIIPSVCKSLGLIHLTYEGSFPIKIFIKSLREFLNCVTAVSGLFLLWSLVVKQEAIIELVEEDMTSRRSRNSKSLFFSRKPLTLYVTSPA